MNKAKTEQALKTYRITYKMKYGAGRESADTTQTAKAVSANAAQRWLRKYYEGDRLVILSTEELFED